MDSLVSTEWLAEHLGQADIAIFDASMFLPNAGRNAAAEFEERHIPGAQFFDISAISDRSNPAPNMLPSAADFAAAMSAMGINNSDRIVVYDNSPLRTAVRAWFMLRHFGATQVAMLDGGLGKWLAEGRPTESGPGKPRSGCFEASERPGEVVTKGELAAGLEAPLLDARGKGRFEGSEPEPRPDIQPGHIPGSRNLPFSALYNEDGTFRTLQEIRAAFAAAGADPERPFVATCASGVTANSLIFAAHLIGNDDARLYDGSWSEWGADPSTPKAVGPA